MNIYTKTGDDGTTGLIGGKRVLKSDDRIECVGALDQINAAIGLAAVATQLVPASPAIAEKLRAVQNDLFTISSHLAAPTIKDVPTYLPPISRELITRLETQIDAAEKELPPLKNFILPGGGELAARLHMARVICRAAERELVAFAASNDVPPLLLIYINRLSDWLFVQARTASRHAGISDVPWIPK